MKKALESTFGKTFYPFDFLTKFLFAKMLIKIGVANNGYGG